MKKLACRFPEPPQEQAAARRFHRTLIINVDQTGLNKRWHMFFPGVKKNPLTGTIMYVHSTLDNSALHCTMMHCFGLSFGKGSRKKQARNSNPRDCCSRIDAERWQRECNAFLANRARATPWFVLSADCYVEWRMLIKKRANSSDTISSHCRTLSDSRISCIEC